MVSSVPLETVVNTNVTMSMVKARGHPNHDVHYCPDWSAPNKAGAPKKGNRMKSPLEQATKKRKPFPYCVICNNHNHSTDMCKRNPTKDLSGDGSSVGGGNDTSMSKSDENGSETDDDDDDDKEGEPTSDDENE